MKKYLLGLIFALPLTASAASLWTGEQAKSNAASLVKRIAQGEKDLNTAIETGDADGLNRYITAPFAKLLRSWSEQRRELNNPEAEKYAVCHSAAFEFQFYSMSFTKRDSIDVRRDRDYRKSLYRSNLADCKKAVAG